MYDHYHNDYAFIYCFTCKAIEINYREKGALRRVGPHQPAKFETDAITLDIPMEGLSIQGWKITPLMRPVVSFCVTISTQHSNQLPSLATTSGDQGTGGQL